MNENKKKKVLHVISSLEKKGPVQVLYDIIRFSDHNNFEFIIISLKRPIEDSLEQKIQLLPVTIIYTNGTSRFNFLKFYQHIKSIIASYEVDLLHSHCTRSLALGFLLRKKVKVVHSVQIFPGVQALKMNGTITGILINFCTKFFIRRIHRAVACSKSVAKQLAEKENIETEVIVNGSSPVGSFVSQSKSSLRRSLGWSETGTYLISVGRLSPEKNFSFMIEWFKSLPNKDLTLVIIGDGLLEEDLRNMIFPEKNIQLLGFKSDFEKYLYAADIYVSSSIDEGMPLSVLIGMSQGLPLVLSDIPAHREIFETAQEGVNIGMLYSLEYPIFSIDQVLENLVHFGNESQKLYKNCFSAEIMTKKYNDFYIRQIGER